MKNTLLLLALFFYYNTTHAQSLPKEFHLSTDGKILTIGDRTTTGFYKEDVIREIRLTFSQSNYLTLLSSNYSSKTDLLANMTIDGVPYDSVGVRYKGQTSYRSVSGLKKSFNISLDFSNPDRKTDGGGYKTLNLNNAFEDPSFMREVIYYHQLRKHTPASKANFVHLYVNGNDYGIYLNVQQLNKDFLEEWFVSNDGSNWRADAPAGSTTTIGPGGGGGAAWGNGTTALNYLGDAVSTYQQYYDLKSSDQENPWGDLPKVCKILNQTPLAYLEDSLANYLDIDRCLWHLASEILFCDDDSYVYKGRMDYYLYEDAETKRFITMDYDGNSSFNSSAASSWSPFYNETKVNYPLMNRLFAVPRLRQRYLAHFRTLINDVLYPTSAEETITQYATLIDALVKSDPIKLNTYTAFQSGVTTLKNFITNRRNYVLSNTEVAQVAPAISNVTYYTDNIASKNPNANQAVNIQANITHSNGLSSVYLYYGTGIYGTFSKTLMYDDGQHNDGTANDGIYGATIPKQNSNTWVRFYVEAAADNPAKSIAYSPVGAEHSVYVYQVNAETVQNSNVVINEFMASNSATAKDEAGEFDDWIELYNKSNITIDLSGYFLSDNPQNLKKWEFPSGSSIAANGYLIIWADENGKQGNYHANFKLSADGESIYLITPQGAIADSLTFGKQTTDKSSARIPNGTGNFVSTNPTFNANNGGTTPTNEVDITQATMTLMPNPANQQVNIRLENAQKQPIQVFSSIGQLIYQAPFEEDITLNTDQWAIGLYVVKSGNLVQKLLVQR